MSPCGRVVNRADAFKRRSGLHWVAQQAESSDVDGAGGVGGAVTFSRPNSLPQQAIGGASYSLASTEKGTCGTYGDVWSTIGFTSGTVSPHLKLYCKGLTTIIPRPDIGETASTTPEELWPCPGPYLLWAPWGAWWAWQRPWDRPHDAPQAPSFDCVMVTLATPGRQIDDDPRPWDRPQDAPQAPSFDCVMVTLATPGRQIDDDPVRCRRCWCVEVAPHPGAPKASRPIAS
ncbi:hypothetical protein PtA15_7A176 [Puccinia triticina]|uniref:Uncharacterized protein n=1 Tax=Puccinia triticina TaxID=208348 RepID=A0ABY7CRQ0_9BASI|nr:uncharacterized protein PtA15_7A176 [Puccinia triticina]WAQ86450.1 hypothetical protein PtA15_7A176 [Puccinia triticina]WAR56330.1 hypothetical protein PtB15_7B176 [Puccinia triticina]